MRPRRLLVPRDTNEIFEQAVRERALAILTFQVGNEWQTFKSRFLEVDPRGRFFVLDYQQVTDTPLPPVAPGQYMGISFRHKNRKILFATVIEAKGHYVLEDKTTVPAVRYRWPNSLTELQRRAYHRTEVPEDAKLMATLWLGGLTTRPAVQSSEVESVSGELADISCGGAMVRLHNTRPPAWSEDDLLGVELQLPDHRTPVQVNARFRGLRQEPNEKLGLAVQFLGLEVAADGRAVLQRLAATVQRFYRQNAGAGRRDSNSGTNL